MLFFLLSVAGDLIELVDFLLAQLRHQVREHLLRLPFTGLQTLQSVREM